MNFLFWNVAKRDVKDALVSLIESTKADVIVLAEYEGDDADLLKELHEHKLDYFVHDTVGCFRIKIFSKLEPVFFQIRYDASRFTVREFLKPGMEPILMVFVHLPSQQYKDDVDQLQDAIIFRQEIENIEKETKNTNTIILGDFNMNPFSGGMISAQGFHAISCLQTAKALSRAVQDREYSFFYNPTWNLLGDRNSPPGTYFYRSSSYISYFWSVLDQLILRPLIAEKLDLKSLQVITSAGKMNFLDSRGRPSISDHLPVFFSMNLSIGGNNAKSLA